jgi:hypothetical protein
VNVVPSEGEPRGGSSDARPRPPGESFYLPSAPPPTGPPPGSVRDRPLGPAASARPAEPPVLTDDDTAPDPVELPLEALVTSVSPVSDGPEHRAVLELCRTPRSVAEVAALLRLPLGAARIAVDDLLAARAVTVQPGSGDNGPDLAELDRIREGLRRL